ncbi:MAG: hypothetical protein GX894_06410, partial [Clostridia bacterium]|nr:hypothetical protein [Clostridia bacterium]
MRVGLGKQRRFFRRNTSLPGRKFPLKKRVIFIPLLILAGFFYAEHRLRPALHEISRARAVQIATQSINKAVREQVVAHIRYEDLITVRVDNRGRVV